MNTKRILQTIAVAVTGVGLSTVVACGVPQQDEPETQYPDYSETMVGDGHEFDVYEVRFTDTEGNKIKCFTMDGYNSGGLDACEKVG